MAEVRESRPIAKPRSPHAGGESGRRLEGSHAMKSDASRSDATKKGSCLCEGVAFELGGELTPVQLCHAKRCRKATGAGAAPELLASAKGFRWLRGADLVRTYEAPLLKEPPTYRRCFCDTCGSPLPAQIPGTDFVLINPGILDDDPGTRAFRHAFVGEKAPWHEITDSLPTFDGQPPGPSSS